MANTDQIPVQANDVVLSAEYFGPKVWLVIIVLVIPVMCFFSAIAYLSILDGTYTGSLALLVAASALIIALDSLFLKEIVFFQDRVMKAWHLLGQRTIYYSKASVTDPRVHMGWLSSSGVHYIFESNENGKPVRWRIPIGYIPFFFPSDTARTINMIMDYMTEDKENNPKKFKKAMLPKEVIELPTAQ
ncbi:MAG: hypothetical protein ACOYXY_13225 [Thermodesulfobacteriota bacterium]